jgi:hypothetical protein
VKKFEVVTGANCRTVRIVTEAAVCAALDALPKGDAEQRRNGERVLALGVGETVTFASGNQYTRVEDDADTNMMAIMCTRGSRSAKPCVFCGRKLHAGGLLCDGLPPKGARRATCDAFMCRKCAKAVGPNRDLCPRCAAVPALTSP